jgi:PadR family transcriptional regulator PadR
MYNNPMNLKGTLPTLILQTLDEGPNHGYVIAQIIKSRSKGVLDFKEGTLYPALHTLEGKGMLVSYEKTESGRTRRYYKLTEKGHKALDAEREAWKKLSGAVNLILERA